MNALKAKPWAVLAVISLTLNLFLGGLVVGRFLRPDPPPRDMGPIALFRVSRDLDPASREIIERVREQRREGISDAMHEAAEARMKAVDALCAEDFDEARAREAFEAFRKQSRRAHDEMHEALIDVAKAMTPEQRIELREVLQRGKRGKWRGRHHGGPP